LTAPPIGAGAIGGDGRRATCSGHWRESWGHTRDVKYSAKSSGLDLLAGPRVVFVVLFGMLIQFPPSITGRLVLVNFTDREGSIRIISAREATRRERKRYEEEIP
jgi:hypothetical protein